MLNPDFLDHIPDSMVELYAQFESDTLTDIARRIDAFDFWIPAAEWQVKRLEAAGMVREEVLKRLSGMTGRSEKQLKELMKEAAVETLRSDDEVYRRAGLNPLPLRADTALLQVLETGWRKTKREFRNLTATTADTVSKQFENALDRAWLQITSGAFDQNTAVRMAIKDLARQGVGVIKYHPSGHIDTIEVAVRRATITGVNQTCGELQKARAQEMGCDLVEVTAHAGARPSHTEWQGRVYSWSGRSDIYPAFEESTGYGSGAGLCGWNCRHSFYPFFEGVSQRLYSEKELAEMDEKKYTYNGRKLTEYEAGQQQRYIERKIRRWKRQEAAMAGDSTEAAEAAAKVREWQAKQREFLKQTGLKRQSLRESVGKSVSKVPRSGRSKTILKASKKTKHPGKAAHTVSMGDLERSLGKSVAAEMSKRIQASPEITRNVWNAFAKDLKVVSTSFSGTANFNPALGGISVNLRKVIQDEICSFILDQNGNPQVIHKAYGTLFHEFGHNIASLACKKKGMSSMGDYATVFRSKRNSGKTLSEMLKAEAAAHVDEVWLDLKKKALAGGAAKVPKSEAYKAVSKELRGIPLHAQDVSDMFQGATMGKAAGYIGHSVSYWGQHEVGVEAFAEMFDATINNLDSLSQIKKYFPKSYDIFEEMLQDITK